MTNFSKIQSVAALVSGVAIVMVNSNNIPVEEKFGEQFVLVSSEMRGKIFVLQP